MALDKTTHSIMDLTAALSTNDTQHNLMRWVAFFNVGLSVVMLKVVVLSVVALTFKGSTPEQTMNLCLMPNLIVRKNTFHSFDRNEQLDSFRNILKTSKDNFTLKTTLGVLQ